VFPKTEKQPFLADFFIKYKHIAWSDKRCHAKVSIYEAVNVKERLHNLMNAAREHSTLFLENLEI
jgi:hypothetical protein